MRLCCIYVRNGFTIEIFGFMHSLHTFRVHATHGAINIDIAIKGDGRLENKSRYIKDG